MPFNLIDINEVNVWQEQMVDLYQSTEYNYVWMKDYYWKMDIVSCVLVCRNRQWFESNIGELAEIWSTIVAERASGFEHRAPNRKPKSITTDLNNSNNLTSSGCLLNFNKESGKITVIKTGSTTTTSHPVPVISPISNLNIHPFFHSKA